MLETTKETPKFISRLCQCGITIYYKRPPDKDHAKPHFLKVCIPAEEYDPHHKRK